jgi:hypothetical protein
MFSLICRILIKNKCRNVIAHGTHTKGWTHIGKIRKRTFFKPLNVLSGFLQNLQNTCIWLNHFIVIIMLFKYLLLY